MMATVRTRCRSRGWLMALGLAIFAFSPITASADVIDPADLHILGSGSDPVQIGNTGAIEVYLNNNSAGSLDTPWQLILAIPNAGSSFTAPTITSIVQNGGSPISESISGTFVVSMTNSDVYTLMGSNGYPLMGSPGTPNSNSFTNFQTNNLSINGLTPSSYGLFVYDIPVTLTQKTADIIQFGSIPKGTYAVPFGTTTDKKGDKTVFTSAFTNAGLTTGEPITPPPPPVPEPSTMALAALGGLGFLGYGLRRRLRK